MPLSLFCIKCYYRSRYARPCCVLTINVLARSRKERIICTFISWDSFFLIPQKTMMKIWSYDIHPCKPFISLHYILPTQWYLITGFFFLCQLRTKKNSFCRRCSVPPICLVVCSTEYRLWSNFFLRAVWI